MSCTAPPSTSAFAGASTPTVTGPTVPTTGLPTTVSAPDTSAPTPPVSTPTPAASSGTTARNRRRELVLTFSAVAWIKLQYLCHIGDTEIGAFAISSSQNPMYIEDLVMIDQVCSSVSVEFDDEAVADFFDAQIDAGRRPDQFGRIWVHTHPGTSPEPSSTDIDTFQRVFGRCDWAIMFILARGGRTFCRLRVSTPSGRNGGPRLEVSAEVPVRVDYPGLADAESHIDTTLWHAEYTAHVDPSLAQIWMMHESSKSAPARAEARSKNKPDRRRQLDDFQGAFDEEASLDQLIELWEQEEAELGGYAWDGQEGGLT